MIKQEKQFNSNKIFKANNKKWKGIRDIDYIIEKTREEVSKEYNYDKYTKVLLLKKLMSV